MIVRAAQAIALRRATVHGVRWPPVCLAAVAVGGVVAWKENAFAELGTATFMVRMAAVLLALGAVFVLDDAAALTVAASPTPLWWRRMLRYTVAAAFVLPTWVAVLSYAVSRQPDLPWPRLTLELAVLVAFGLAVAAASARWSDATDPGMSAALGVLGFTFVIAHLPPRFAFFAAPGSAAKESSTLRWSVAFVVVLTVLVAASSDPARVRWSLRAGGDRRSRSARSFRPRSTGRRA